MFGKVRKRLSSSEVLGLKPGDEHYRAYVGPPRDYDLISAMVFNLLTCTGLRQEHRLLDIGCGSLRVGRLLIPYLAEGNYVGVEPNKWLVRDGIRNELGNDLVKLKKPQFSYNTSLSEFNEPLELDFAFAQSIFSHCGKDLINGWLSEIHPHLKDSGVFLATLLKGESDSPKDGWVYPECVKFKEESIYEMGQKNGFKVVMLDWAHPRQTWFLFHKPGYHSKLTEDGQVSWQKLVNSRYPQI